MAQYRRVPEMIEAVQWLGTDKSKEEVIAFAAGDERVFISDFNTFVVCDEDGDERTVRIGDYLYMDRGEISVWSKEAFEKEYELVPERPEE